MVLGELDDIVTTILDIFDILIVDEKYLAYQNPLLSYSTGFEALSVRFIYLEFWNVEFRQLIYTILNMRINSPGIILIGIILISTPQRVTVKVFSFRCMHTLVL